MKYFATLTLNQFDTLTVDEFERLMVDPVGPFEFAASGVYRAGAVAAQVEGSKPTGINMVITRAITIAESSVTLLARLQDAHSNDVLAEYVTSVAVKVFDKTLGTQTYTTTPTVSTVIFDTIQEDARWTVDGIGYNFAFTVPGSALPTGGTTYRVEILITPASGDPFFVLYDLQTISIFSE